MDERKTRALMQVLERIIARHHRGLVSLDEPTFELFEIAKNIKWASTEADFQSALTALAEFKK